MNFKGAKLSKSRGTAVEVPYFLSRYDPDPLRFYLTATASRPATPRPALPVPSGTEGSAVEGFSWEDFVERNNHVPSRSPEPREGASEGNELVATHSLRSVQAWGNLCQRPRRALGFMLSFAYKRFYGVVPEPGKLDSEDRALLEKVEAGFETVGELYNACKFRATTSALLRAGLGEAAVAKQLPS